MEYEVNSRPFDEHEMIDDVIEADNALQAAELFARTLRFDGHIEVYVRAAGASDKPKLLTIRRCTMPPSDLHHIEAVAFRLHQASFFAHRPEPGCHVLAKEWMTAAFDHGGRIDDFETRVRAVQLLITFDTFISDKIGSHRGN